jgi:peptidoglycan hydrolase-like protein with peptidoglycan-binding domain
MEYELMKLDSRKVTSLLLGGVAVISCLLVDASLSSAEARGRGRHAGYPSAYSGYGYGGGGYGYPVQNCCNAGYGYAPQSAYYGRNRYYGAGQGNLDNSVAFTQERLAQMGYWVGPSGANGILNSYTRNAIREFQRDNHLRVDGIVGSQTLRALDRYARAYNYVP